MAAKLLIVERFAFLGLCWTLIMACDGGKGAVEPDDTPSQNAAPQLSGTPSMSAQAGKPYAFTPQATDANNDPLTFSISNRPSWAVFSTSSGEITGTPTFGTFDNIVISVSDGQSNTSLPSFTLTVSERPNSPPTITGTPGTLATTGETYTFAPDAHDPDRHTLTFRIANRPPWLSLDSMTGALTGVPERPDIGTFNNIMISVDDGKASASLPSFAIRVKAANRSPVISGVPPSKVLAGDAYRFAPTSGDADGNALTFSATNLPVWAKVDQVSGRVTGTPSNAHVGHYNNIVLSVTDGIATVRLKAFSIQVVATATGSTTLAWMLPTTRTDGSALSNLSGFKVYWGTAQGQYPNSVMIWNPGLTRYVIDQLTPGKWFFVVTAVNAVGSESEFSNVASNIVQ